MKKKTVTFLVSFAINGTLFGVLTYFNFFDDEAQKNLREAINTGLFFGVFMGLCETFVNPAIKEYFSKKRK